MISGERFWVLQNYIVGCYVLKTGLGSSVSFFLQLSSELVPILFAMFRLASGEQNVHV